MKRVAHQKYWIHLLVGISISLLTLPCLCGKAAALDYPKGPITLLVQSAAGGATDITARAVAKGMEKILKVPVVVENKVGGGGSVMWSYLARQKPDGYSIGMITASLILQQYAGVGGPKLSEFEPIAEIAYFDNALSVPTNSPFKNLEDLINYAKKNPGKVRVGNSGTGAIWHLCAVGVEDAAGVKFTHVPFRGGKESSTAMLGGHIEAASTEIAVVSELAKGGKVRILGVTSSERFSMFPDVPTFKERGYNVDMGCFVGLIAPKGTPKEIINILDNAAKKAMETEEYKTIMYNVGNRVRYMNADDFRKLTRTEDVLFYGYMKKLGLEVKK
jgi:tripartite-type tricarboxylate transporter receptor subunit TctC